MTTSQVFWNGSCVESAPPATACATASFNTSSTQLSVTVPAAYIAKVGFPQITVVNPFPGGPSLVAATFTISAAPNPIPTITSLVPSNTPVGVFPPNGMITVNGTNFIQTSTVAFNGIPRATQYVSVSQLTATVLTSDVAGAGGINVQVSNPEPGGGVSTVSTFTVGPVNNAIAHKALFSGALASPELISVSASGGAANGASSTPAMSADGRFVAFYSEATNLVTSGASGSIFVRDTCLGTVNCTPQTIAADLDANGNAPSAPSSEQVAISADGRFVAFSSTAANLVADLGAVAQSKNTKVYVRDLCEGNDVPAGCTPHTELISIDSSGAVVTGASPAISGDGRFVAFVSASEIAQVYVRDTCAGPTANSACVPTTITLDSNGGNPEAGEPLALSSDGRYVAFAVSVSPLMLGNQNSRSAILLADTCEGIDAPAGCVAKTANASMGSDGSLLPGSAVLPSLSGDGRFIVFESVAADSGSVSASGATQLYVRDTCLGATAPNGCVPSTTLVSANATEPSISAAGRFISYVSTQLSTGAASEITQAGTPYVYDTCFGATAPCTPTSYPVAGVGVGSSASVPISSDGSLAAFDTKATVGVLPSSGLGDVFLTPISH
jgi:Tol biopolymer transport system component